MALSSPRADASSGPGTGGDDDDEPYEDDDIDEAAIWEQIKKQEQEQAAAAAKKSPEQVCIWLGWIEILQLVAPSQATQHMPCSCRDASICCVWHSAWL